MDSDKTIAGQGERRKMGRKIDQNVPSTTKLEPDSPPTYTVGGKQINHHSECLASLWAECKTHNKF